MYIFTVEHPLVADRLMELRKKDTPSARFRELIAEISLCLAYEAASKFEMEQREVETPFERITVPAVKPFRMVLVPILRAGLAMAEGFRKIFPGAATAHLGLYRDEETLRPQVYYSNIPGLTGEDCVFVLDPMLATGGSAAAGIEAVLAAGAAPEKITFFSVVACPEGLEHLSEKYNYLNIYTASVDRGLNEKGYILPGVGDAGDRIFGSSEAAFLTD